MPDMNYDEQLQKGLELPRERKIYFNGYVISLNPADFVIMLQNNNQPEAYLNTSHTIAKSLAKTILSIIEDYEKNTGFHIPTLDEVNNALSKKDNEPQPASENQQ